MTYEPQAFPRLGPALGCDRGNALQEVYRQQDGVADAEYILEFAPSRYSGMVSHWHSAAIRYQASFNMLRKLALIAGEVQSARKSEA